MCILPGFAHLYWVSPDFCESDHVLGGCFGEVLVNLSGFSLLFTGSFLKNEGGLLALIGSRLLGLTVFLLFPGLQQVSVGLIMCLTAGISKSFRISCCL